jgi:hypothetical protein
MPVRVAAAAGLVAALAACASLNPFKKPETRPCPTVAVLRDAGQLVQYRPGPGRDILDVRYSVDIADITGSCKYSRDALEVTVSVDLIFTKGPAAEGAEMSAPYFVAVTRGGDDILAKKIFDSTIEFPANRRRAGVREEVDQFIRLQPDETGAAYEIIVGLQVSEEQLERNRKR